MGKEKFDIYETVTNLFIEGLKEGKIPWKKPYTGFQPKNVFSNTQYHGINTMILGMEPYEIPWYLTFKQCQKLGGKIKKGSKSQIIVYWNFIQKKGINSKGEEKTDVIPFLRYYRVFNISQVEGIEFDIPTIEEKKEFEKIEKAENIIEKYKIPTFFDSSIPYYTPTYDQIHLPKKEVFHSNHDFYSTIFHEMVHSTGHKKRLDRKMEKGSLSGKGIINYSKEELVAEIGSSFLNHYCEFGDIEQRNSQAYINGWIKYLEDDKKAIVSASGKAQKAADYIISGGKNNE